MEVLSQAEQFFWQGKYVEALTLLEQVESRDAVSPEEWGQGQVLKCRILVHQDINQAQPLITQLLKMSQERDQPLLKVDALLVQAELWWHLLNFNKLAEVIHQGKAAWKTLTDALQGGRVSRGVDPIQELDGLVTEIFQPTQEESK